MTMHDRTAELRRMSEVQLMEDLAGWKPGSEYHLQTAREIRRRENRWAEVRSWLALAISVVAVLVAYFKP